MYPSLAATAKAQMALFTLEQARAAGYSPRQIQYRRETGEWDQVHSGVYRVAGVPESWEQRLLAASMAAGPGAVVSHRSAARLWGFAEEGPSTIELSVPPGRTHRLEGVIVHRSTDLLLSHVTRRNGLAVTTPARTLVDLGAVQPARAVEQALDVALSRRVVTLPELRSTLEFVARQGRRGAGILRALLADRSAAAGLTESVLEARMLRLCRHHDLPEPVCQHEVRSGSRLVGRLDFAYPDDPRRHRARRLRVPLLPPRLPPRPEPSERPGGQGLDGPALHLARRDPASRTGRRRRPLRSESEIQHWLLDIA